MAESVKVLNASFELFIPGSGGNPRLVKLKEQFARKEAYDLVKFCKKVTMSPEFEAYVERRKKIVEVKQKEFEEKGIKNGMISASTVPEWLELMEMESGLEIEKHKVPVSKIPDWKDEARILTANDMEILDPFFEFVYDEE